MNRNTESHFSQLPQVDIQRSMFNRGSAHKTSFNTGELIPLYVDEILPGDTVQMSTSKVVRLQTLLTPIMDNMYLDTYWFYVPNRLVWSHWREFCGENTQSAWAPHSSYFMPYIKSPANGFESGTIADYMGIPVNVNYNNKAFPSALPFRGYALICNEFFRDQNLTDPLNIPTGDAAQTGSNGSNYISDVANGGKPFKVAKYHDYFTSCLPAPQKGDASFVPITIPSAVDPVYSINTNVFPAHLGYYDDGVHTPAQMRSAIKFTNTNDANSYLRRSAEDYAVFTADGNTSHYPQFPTNLWSVSPERNAGTISINEFRLAFQLQKFLERNARGGTRYIEILKSHFGVTSPDARLQRPEYLGGNRVQLSIHQVTNNAQSEQDFLGDLGAMSVTADVHADFTKSFVEHGYLFCLGCVRYDHTYSQGFERFWQRRVFTDFFLPVFSNIGEQPVFSDELFFDPSHEGPRDVFGYQEAWADYRYKPNRVSGEMRPNISNTLASWHLADNYITQPILSDGWIREDKTNVDRVLAVSSSVSNQIFADYYFDAIYTRPMPMYSIPGLIDHN